MPHIRVRLTEALYTILHTVSIYRGALAILTFIPLLVVSMPLFHHAAAMDSPRGQKQSQPGTINEGKGGRELRVE